MPEPASLIQWIKLKFMFESFILCCKVEGRWTLSLSHRVQDAVSRIKLDCFAPLHPDALSLSGIQPEGVITRDPKAK